MVQRMNRAELFEQLSPLSAERLREIVWTVYWRGSADVRERIEEALAPPSARPKTGRDAKIDAGALLAEVERFVALARSGAYLGGTREVHRTERSKWRVTFRRLIDDASRAVSAGDLDCGRRALEALIDLACECQGYEYFHSDDPVAAMRLVVSDKVKLSWLVVVEHEGFPAFVRRATPQLIRWEARYGWTRGGFHAICEHEMQLADVVAEIVRGRGGLDHWIAIADAYVDALGAALEPRGVGENREYELKRRTDRLTRFHELLLERLAGTEAEDRLDRIATHPALGGPELSFFKARLAHHRGDLDAARRLTSECLCKLPGHNGFLAFAKQIAAPLPPRAKAVAQKRERDVSLRS
jgi:hypothetical protein